MEYRFQVIMFLFQSIKWENIDFSHSHCKYNLSVSNSYFHWLRQHDIVNKPAAYWEHMLASSGVQEPFYWNLPGE